MILRLEIVTKNKDDKYSDQLLARIKKLPLERLGNIVETLAFSARVIEKTDPTRDVLGVAAMCTGIVYALREESGDNDE